MRIPWMKNPHASIENRAPTLRLVAQFLNQLRHLLRLASDFIILKTMFV
jgi:hypothetical protein